MPESDAWSVPCTMSYHFTQSHIRRVPRHACLAVTCHLHVWQPDFRLLRATAVTGGWNGYGDVCVCVLFFIWYCVCVCGGGGGGDSFIKQTGVRIAQLPQSLELESGRHRQSKAGGFFKCLQSSRPASFR